MTLSWNPKKSSTVNDEQARLQRAVYQPPVGPDGYFMDTGVYDWIHEEHTRQWMARRAQYADELGCGNGRLYDRFGRYLCGGYKNQEEQSCNKYKPGLKDYPNGGCTEFNKEIKGPNGSCDWWENFAGQLDPEFQTSELTGEKRDGLYVEDPTGEGFGCNPRCPHGLIARGVDPQGRRIFCRWWGTHVTETACCSFNGRENVITFVNDEPVLPNNYQGLMETE